MDIGEYKGVDGHIYQVVENWSKLRIRVTKKGETKVLSIPQYHPDWKAARKAQNERGEWIMQGGA